MDPDPTKIPTTSGNVNHGKVKFPDGLDDKKGVEQLGRLDDEPGELIPDEVEELRAAVGKTEELGTKKRLSRGNEGEQSEATVVVPEQRVSKFRKINPPDLLNLRKSPFYDNFDAVQKGKFEEFFMDARTSEAAWQLYDTQEERVPPVLGSDIQDLLFNRNLDETLVYYYRYKRIIASRKKPNKYFNSEILIPSASIGMLRKLETVINEEVIDAISKMDQTTEKLIIPVNTCCRLPGVYNVEQWHLLVFDIIRFEWKNYNSCKDGKIIEKCLRDCDEIAKICETPLNNWFAKHQRGVQLHNAGVGVEYVAQQGRHADCLLFMCDSMKSCCKRFNAPEYGNLKMQLRMQRKRVRLAYKLLTASYPESSWSKFTTLEYLMQFAFE